MSYEQVREVLVVPDGCPLDDPNLAAFALRVSWAGPVNSKGTMGGWKVTHVGSELSRAGNWGYPARFQIHQYRWATMDEALSAAHAAADLLRVNGRTWAEWQARPDNS